MRQSLGWGLLASVVVACGGGEGGGQPPDDSGVPPITVSGTGTDTGGSGTAAETEAPTDGADSTGDTGGASCMASMDCPEAQACAAGECVPTDGPCETDSDCDGDTYCCAGGCLPDDEEGGWCIPYGLGPLGDVNDECLGDVVIGLFEPDLQCEWTAPPAGDPYPDHVNVLTTPMVAQLPYDSGVAGEIALVTYNCTDGGSASSYGSDPNCYGVIRILNGQTCEQIDTIDDPSARLIAATPPAIGDLDGDGSPEIVSLRAVSGVVAFTWDDAVGRYDTLWVAEDSSISAQNRWDGPAIHDLDGDGAPEVVSSSEVYDGVTGARLNPGQLVAGGFGVSPGVFSVVGDLQSDGQADLIANGIWSWDVGSSSWLMTAPGTPGGRHYGFADFGTPGATPADFDRFTLDGVAEIVTVGNGTVLLHTLDGQELMSVGGIAGGGPPTIGDFDNDGFPEVASAGGNFYRVFDLDCADPMTPGCAAGFIRWIQTSQDLSSSNTGSSIFDFEGDGQAEAVYGDECYLRVYEGGTGEVLYSAPRTSCTWYENPIVVDLDQDDNTEILVGSNTNCGVGCPAIDPIHRGLRCEDGTGCPSGICDAGFCRCAGDAECPAEHSCAAPPAETPGAGDTCRAANPPGLVISGVRVLRDRLDRWASSRPLWNQHAYSITNVEDDLSVPATGVWEQNFSLAERNNYRQNEQGAATAEELPDITGRLEDTACTLEGSDVTLMGTVCNRGLRAVAAALPATFYLGEPGTGEILCVAYTAEPVPVGQCREVSCPIGSEVSGLITMVVNDDGQGGALTVECNEDNNTDTVDVADCNPPA
ncbi:MAG: VCBS repeat-containing protein [Myxococcota bacterium]